MSKRRPSARPQRGDYLASQAMPPSNTSIKAMKEKAASASPSRPEYLRCFDLRLGRPSAADHESDRLAAALRSGFLAGVVKKKLKLKIKSEKIGEHRVYRIVETANSAPSRLAYRRAPDRHAPCNDWSGIAGSGFSSTSRSRTYAASMSMASAHDGGRSSGEKHPLTFLVICCFGSWLIECRPISWVISPQTFGAFWKAHLGPPATTRNSTADLIGLAPA